LSSSGQAQHLDRGREAEQIAGKFLQSHGYRILERNFCCRQGEIDLIVMHKQTIYFVEVKGRWSGKFGRPLDQITNIQTRRIRRAAELYLRKMRWKEDIRIRFAVLGVDSSQQPPRIEFIPDAF